MYVSYVLIEIEFNYICIKYRIVAGSETYDMCLCQSLYKDTF